MSLLDHTPTTTVVEAELIARELYGVEAVASELSSERDRVFRLDAGTGESWVLKVANALESREVLEAQHAAAALAAAAGVPVQRVRTTLAGDEIGEVGAISSGCSSTSRACCSPTSRVRRPSCCAISGRCSVG